MKVRDVLKRHPERIGPASSWMARLDRGLSLAEQQELKSWLFEAKANLEVFMAMAHAWDRMNYLSLLSEWRREQQQRVVQRSLSGLAVAASVVVACALLFWVVMPSGLPEADTPSDYYAESLETSKGQRLDKTLPDGSSISLNTNTRLTIHYSAGARNLYLERGEVNISVESDPGRPLSLYVGQRVFRAVGTEFNVEISDDDQIELLVTEGIVMVGVLPPDAQVNADESPVLLGDTSSLVSAGRSVTLSSSVQLDEPSQPQKIDSEDIAVKLSWRDGNLIFRGEALEDAIAEVGRYTEIEFVFLDESAKRQKVSGLFRAGDVSGLLMTLRNNFNITHEQVSSEVVVLKMGSVE